MPRDVIRLPGRPLHTALVLLGFVAFTGRVRLKSAVKTAVASLRKIVGALLEK